MILMRKSGHEMLIAALEAEDSWKKMESHSDPAISKEAYAARELAGRSARKLEKFQQKKADFDKLKAEAKTQMERLKDQGEFSGEKINGVLKFARDNEKTVSFLVSSVSALGKAGKKLAKAMK